MQMPLRVLLVDGNALIEAGLRALLAQEPDIEVVAAAGADHTMLAAGGGPMPQLLLLDRTMPGMNGIEAAPELKRRYSNARVLMILPDRAEDSTRASLQAGADGWIHKDATQDEWRFAIRSALQGSTSARVDVSERGYNACQGTGASSAASALDALTRREREVLKLVAAGKSSKDIAALLGLSVKTVGKHRANLMAKLDVHNAASLTAYAIERGLLPR